MKKRLLTFLLLLALLASMAAVPALAATDLSIPDRSMSYTNYTSYFGKATRVGESTEQALSYTVPSGGVTVLMFIRTDGKCGNTNTLLAELSGKAWAARSDIRFVAMDATCADAGTVSSYLADKGCSGVIDEAWYNTQSNMPAFWYKQLVENGGNMDGVNSVGGSISFPYVLLVTESGGVKTIRSELEGVKSADTLNRELSKLIDTGETPVSLVDVRVPGSARYDYVNAVFESVNENRAANGKSALTLSAELTDLAMQRAAETAVFWSHERPNGETCFTVTVDGMSYSGFLSAENIAAGQTGPEAVMTSWMNSDGHRANILSECSQVGVGCYENNGKLYWVQLFGEGTDGAPTKTACVSRIVSVETLTTRLELSLSDGSALTVKAGENVDGPKLYTVNTGWSGAKAVLYPYASLPASGGTALVSASWSGDHLVLTGLEAGSGSLKLCAYAGQSDAPGVTVTVQKDLSIRYASKTIKAGESFRFTATGGTSPYTWRVGNTATATVDSTGLVTGKSAGNTYLYCKDAAGTEVKCLLKITGEPLSIRYSSKTIVVGQSFQFTATGGVSPYTWRTGNTAVATVDGSGKVTGVTAGNTYLYCTDSAGNQAKCLLKIAAPLSIRYASKTIMAGGSFQFTATGGVGGYTWSVGNTATATVDANGKVTGKSAANTYLYCKDSAGNTVKCLLKIVPALSIRFSEKTISVGAAFQFSATGGTGGYTWRVGNTSTATVDGSGKVTGKAVGNTYLYCKDSAGNEVRCLLKIKA